MFNNLVEKARNGDKKALEEIIERLQPLLISSIRRYYNKPKEYDDLMQDGNLRIIESISEYDKSKNVNFLGFIKMNIKFLYLDKHKERYHQSLDEKIGDEDNTMMDYLLSEEIDFLENMIKKENTNKLKKAIKTLTERQKQVIEMFYGRNMSIGNIADELGIAYRTVINTKTRALEKIRKAIDR